MLPVNQRHYKLNQKTSRVGDQNPWVEFCELTQKYNAIDLTQGFPDYDSLGYLNRMIENTLNDSDLSIQQYTRSQVSLSNLE